MSQQDPELPDTPDWPSDNEPASPPYSPEPQQGQPEETASGGPVANPASAIRFLQWFFKLTTEKVELRPLPSKERTFTRSPGQVKKFVRQHSHENIYFGVATREGRKGDKGACREITALWADIDLRNSTSDHAPTHEHAEKLLDAFQFSPSLVIESGGGWHVYWLLSRPIQAKPEVVEPVLRWVAAKLRADPAAAEMARVMRLPGSLNWKYNPPRACKVSRADWSRRYDFGQFASVAHGNGVKTPRKEVSDFNRIAEGNRNKELTRCAGTMRRRGMSPEAIETALIEENRRRCDPPSPSLRYELLREVLLATRLGSVRLQISGW